MEFFRALHRSGSLWRDARAKALANTLANGLANRLADTLANGLANRLANTVVNAHLIAATLATACVSLTACGPTLPDDVAAATQSLPDRVDFNFQVKPILSDKCFACHGPDARTRKAGLRLDVRDAAVGELPESPGKHAIVPGKPEQSELFHRILSSDAEFRMPSRASNKSLTPLEKATLVRWIEQGAEYRPHWAFIQPVMPKLPGAEVPGGNEIDRFVAARLKSEGLKPAAPADRESLLNRVTFDLTGLPPSPAEMSAFLADQSAGAYEKVVDRLLASPRYGERMASYWMDVARFADTDGYQLDGKRRLFPWRDWVIDAFNHNMPYDQFVTWQLAGDLMPQANRAQLVATAFNRLHRRNAEEGTDAEEYRVEYVLDRTNTFGKAFLGLTLECARCHDHKYDPISQKAYYQTSAFFNSTNENGLYTDIEVTPGAATMLPSAEQEAAIGQARAQVEERSAALSAARTRVAAAAAEWASSVGQKPATLRAALEKSVRSATIAYYPFDEITGQVPYVGTDRRAQNELLSLTPNVVDSKTPAQMQSALRKPGVKGQAFFIGDYSAAFLGKGIGDFEQSQPFSVDLWVYPNEVYEDATVFLRSNYERHGFRGYNLLLKKNRLRFMMSHAWPHDNFEVLSEEALPAKQWSHVTLTYSGSGRAEGVHLYVGGTPVHLTTLRDQLQKSVLVDAKTSFIFTDRGLSIGVRSPMKHMTDGGIDEMRVFNRQLSGIEVRFLNDPATPAASEESLREYAIEQAAEVSTARADLSSSRDALVKLLGTVPEIMTMGDTEQKRQAYILKRGLFSEHGDPVEPTPIEAILPFDAGAPRNRLGLAKWLFDPKHPLTARVFVNRLWQMHFGRGLVETAADFGAQGTPPSHPELLDWLAVTFRQSGWDIKAMHRRIVLSATYRQLSAPSPESLKRDPQNVLLARGPRFRLSAEMIRDNALAVSGLLVERVGGESQFPYVPKGYTESSPGVPVRYPAPADVGDGLYRRSLYTTWKRSAPPPFMVIFDKTDADVCTVTRSVTSSPLQALALLNDTQFVEAARVLAQNVEKSTAEPDARLAKIFYSLIRRAPDAVELAKLKTFHDAERARFSAAPDDARAYLGVGQSPFDSSLDVADTAALSVIASVVMNTPEAYTSR